MRPSFKPIQNKKETSGVQCVYCAVRTGSLHIFQGIISPKGLVCASILHDNEEAPHVLLHVVHQVQSADPNSIKVAVNVALKQQKKDAPLPPMTFTTNTGITSYF
jgi:hypothetical protein